MPRATVWFLVEDIQLCNRLSAHVEPFRNAVNALCCTYSHMTCVEYLRAKVAMLESVLSLRKRPKVALFLLYIGSLVL